MVPHKADLTGHWHVYPLQKSSLGATHCNIMEIAKNGTGIFGLTKDGGGFRGKIDTWKKTMTFGGECLVLDFTYQFSNQGLILEQQNYGGKFLATKCEENCCDKQQDFFAYQNKVQIDLPIAKDTFLLFQNNIPPSLENRLLFGLPKSYSPQCFGPFHTLVLEDKIAQENDIPIWYEKQKIKISDANHPRMKVVIYADKDTRMSTIRKSLEKCELIGLTKVYFALRSENTHQDFKIWLLPFNLKYWKQLKKQSLTIGKWLPLVSTPRYRCYR